MNKIVKGILIVGATIVALGLIGIGLLYFYFCTGHPHGMC